jgi:hypothetical protein
MSDMSTVQVIFVPVPILIPEAKRWGWWDRAGRPPSSREPKTLPAWRPAQTIPDRSRLIEQAQRLLSERRAQRLMRELS